MHAGPRIKAEVVTLLRARDHAGLRKRFQPWLAADLAPMLAELSEEELAALVRVTKRELSAAIFGYLPVKSQKKLLQRRSHAQAAALLNVLPPDDRTTFLNGLPVRPGALTRGG